MATRIIPKIGFGMISGAIWYEYHTRVFAVHIYSHRFEVSWNQPKVMRYNEKSCTILTVNYSLTFIARPTGPLTLADDVPLLRRAIHRENGALANSCIADLHL